MFRCLAFLGFCSLLCAEVTVPEAPPAGPASLDSKDLEGFSENPTAVSALLEQCLALTKQNLGYKFGSADPAQGGMDCSGTIYYVLPRVSG